MDQQKTGKFLKELRNKKGITQEQFAERLGVSNRSISRWENGVTMPDFDLLIQMAKYYDVEIGEILDGERKVENMDKQTEETLLKIADYNNMDKESFSKRIHYVFIAGLVCMFIYIAIDITGLSGVQPYEAIADLVLGLLLGGLVTGVLYSSRYITKIKAAKMRLFNCLTKVKVMK
ncbi:MAG: helix-turn-helix transcriptional regulator [Lachnospiraceae bacterium]|nr:helix-turn-helix transcriptional regulator [Lachnospiraceae bacterium]